MSTVPEGHISGATPPADRSGLRLKHLKTLEEIYGAEMEEVGKAQLKYLARKPTPRMAPFTRKWMCKVHAEMFGKIWSWAGQFRRDTLSIGIQWHQVPMAVEELAGNLAQWHTNDWGRLKQAVQLHYQAVHIHPFQNGNGRWSRLLANIWGMQHGLPIVRWPSKRIANQASAERPEYIAALKAADKGNFAPLTQLHQRFMEP